MKLPTITAALCALAMATEAPLPIVMPASVQTLQVGGNWTRFQYATKDTKAQPAFFLYLEEGQEALLQVTDYYCSGDRFSIMDNGKVLGTTSKAAFDHCLTRTEDIDEAFASSKWSSGQYRLKSGGHQISLRVEASPGQTGAGAVRVVAKHCGC